jgi:Flp pilus assembly protein protease CpaA
LVIAAIWRVFHGGWLEVLLVVVLILISDLPQRKMCIALACLACFSSIIFTGSAELIYAILAIFAAWTMWEAGATGGADAKIIITLILLFGNGLLLIPILLAGGFQGLFGLVMRRKTIPYTIAISSGTMIWFSLLFIR